MSYAIVYSSRTGNTRLLADTVRQALDLSLTPCPNCNPPAPSTYYAETGEAQTESQEGQG